MITVVIEADAPANITNTVPITQATKAFFATPIFSGLPAAVRYKIPVIRKPINTIVPPTVARVVETLVAIHAKVVQAAKTIFGKTTTPNNIKNNIFLFTLIQLAPTPKL